MTSYKVVITKKADSDESAIYSHIVNEFGEIYAIQFREKLFKFFELLMKQPFIGRPAKNNTNIRVFVLNKRNKIVYSITENEIVILRILNTKTITAYNY